MSLAPEAILRLSKADYIVVSDGEEPFRVLLECLESKKKPITNPWSWFNNKWLFPLSRSGVD